MRDRRRQPAAAAGSLDVLWPLVGFIVANRIGGLRWAVATATAASVAIAVRRKQRGHQLGILFPVVSVVIIGRGVLAIAFDSQDLYFGLGIAGKYALGLGCIASVATTRSAAARLAPLLLALPAQVDHHPEWVRAMRRVSTVGGLYYLCSATLDVVLYRNSSVEGYLIVRLVANWPLAALAIIGAVAVSRGPRQHIDGLPPLLELIDAKWRDEQIVEEAQTQ